MTSRVAEMKSLLLVCFLLSCLRWATTDSSTTRDLLWPLPHSVTFGSNVYSLKAETFTFIGTGKGATEGDSSKILKGAFDRYITLIFHTPAPFIPSGGRVGASQLSLASLEVHVMSDDSTLGENTNETYTLDVAAGVGVILAPNVYAALRGLETFSQLVYRNPDNSFSINEVKIVDKPRFNFRGFLIDTSNHYLPMKLIYQHLDAMAYNKFNILHWHIVDRETFPFESTKFPNLSLQGAFDREDIYTHTEIAEMIVYAKERGIRVISEFDTPGHTLAWGKGELNLLTKCYSGANATGTFGPINPILDSTWKFLSEFFKEVTELFPDEYLHLGGDEVDYTCWESNPQIQKWMEDHNYKDFSELEQYYETRLFQLIHSMGRQYIVWQEIFENGLTFPPMLDPVIDVWKYYDKNWPSTLFDVTKAGLKSIVSACWYLDIISYGEDWPHYYNCDPQDFNGSVAQNSLVMGGEACLWTDYINANNFLPRAWPRGGAPAERLWSDRSVTDNADARVRLNNMMCRLISRGIPAEPLYPESFCAMTD